MFREKCRGLLQVALHSLLDVQCEPKMLERDHASAREDSQGAQSASVLRLVVHTMDSRELMSSI